MRFKVKVSRFSTKVFAAIFLSSILMVTVATLTLGWLFERQFRQAFIDRYTALTETLGYSLVQVEQNTDILMANAAQVVRSEEQVNPDLATSDLKSLARRTSVTHLFLIDASGTFIRSTNEEPRLIPNLFSFCDGYRRLLNGAASVMKTPIIPPAPEPKPYKFLLIPNARRNRIIEVGMRADFIGETLEKALAGDTGISRLSLFAPNGAPLGVFDRQHLERFEPGTLVQRDALAPGPMQETSAEMTISTRVSLREATCCECEVAHLSDGMDYYYTLIASVSKATLNQGGRQIRMVLVGVGAAGFLTSLLLSLYLSRRLVAGIGSMTSRLDKTFSAADLAMGTFADNLDEIGVLSRAFEAMASRIRESQRDLIIAERSVAVARTTQMLAHDVRKPFSILTMGLGMLSRAKDPAGVQQVLDVLVPDVDRAIRTVNGLLRDIMEIGANSSTIDAEAANPESLVKASLEESLRAYPEADVTLHYEFTHTNAVVVDVLKTRRVLSNLIDNAIQAMGQHGDLWFHTCDDGAFIEFRVGNSGSFIPPEDRARLFDAFFTKGKEGGTGLGLAIAQKIVSAHGGRIWCASKPGDFSACNVEFAFTLPAAVGVGILTTARLPSHSKDITAAQQHILDTSTATSVADAGGDLALGAAVVAASLGLRRPLRILIVDDEPIYRNALAALLATAPNVHEALSVVEASSSAHALSIFGSQSFDITILDIDLGSSSLDGFRLARELRKISPPHAFICLCSNRLCDSDEKTAIASGADLFFRKPMLHLQLLELIELASKQGHWQESRGITTPTTRIRPLVALVEDDEFVCEAWSAMLDPDAEVHVFQDPERFFATVRATPSLLNSLSLVITDYYFGNSIADGLSVGRVVKAMRPELPVFLCSDGEFSLAEVAGIVDRIINKQPIPLARLLSATEFPG